MGLKLASEVPKTHAHPRRPSQTSAAADKQHLARGRDLRGYDPAGPARAARRRRPAAPRARLPRHAGAGRRAGRGGARWPWLAPALLLAVGVACILCGLALALDPRRGDALGIPQASPGFSCL
eukprot:tig00000093_g3588.t1